MSASIDSIAKVSPDNQHYELPSYDDVVIKRWQPDSKRVNDGVRGTIYTDVVTMTDGHSYPVVMGLPRERQIDLPVVFTTAWFTSTHGHNRHTLMRFMEQGIPAILIGSEGTHRHNRLPRLRSCANTLGTIALSRSAHAMHAILDEVPASRGIDTTQVMLLGESRGAMVGMGFLAYAARYRRGVTYADLTAPCFPKKLELSDLPDMTRQVIEEPRQALRYLGAFSVGRLLYYPSTFDLHPQALAHHVATAPALFSGEAGDMARLIPHHQRLHITTFLGDFASMPHVWDEIFADYPHFVHTSQEGAHLSIVDDDTLQAIQRRIMAGLVPVPALALVGRE